MNVSVSNPSITLNFFLKPHVSYFLINPGIAFLMGIPMVSPPKGNTEEVNDVSRFIDIITEELGRGNSLIVFGIDDSITIEEAITETARQVGFKENLEVNTEEFLEEVKPLGLLVRSAQGYLSLSQVLIHVAIAKDGALIHVIINSAMSYNILIGITHSWFFLLKVSRDKPEENTFIKTKATPMSIVLGPVKGDDDEF